MLNITFEDCKTQTAIKNKVRAAMLDKIIQMFSAEFGEDRISVVFSGESTTTEISIGVVDIETESGLAEICVNLKPVVKDFEDRVTQSKTIKAYERLCEEDFYKAKQEEKRETAKKKAKAKADKIARDKKAREDKKKKE